MTEDDIKPHGHAIELRVYAEDHLNNFLPSIGTLTKYQKPVGEGIRVDDGYEEGMTIPIYYDPMIAKLVVHGKTRTEAIQKMLQAIKDYKIEGVATTLPLAHLCLSMMHSSLVILILTLLKIIIPPRQ